MEQDNLKRQVEDAWQNFSQLRHALHDHVYAENESLKIQLAQARQQLEGYSHKRFVLVLIDGDGMPFLDSLVGAGIDDGESAERMLRQNIASYCTQLRVFSENNDSILIRVFANVGNFANAYDLSDGPRGSDYRSFVLGFNRANKFSEYIDVGNN